MSNTITAYFKGRVGVAESVYQYDHGLVMVFDSINLPAHFDCYFSAPGSEESIPAIGADNRVVIPDAVLNLSGAMSVHIPIHTGENDSEVEYIAYFRVVRRARPVDDGTPTQMTAIEQALALLQNPIGNIEQIVSEALAFTGETFEEMQEELDTWKGGVDSDIDSLEAQFQTAISAVTTDTEVTNIRVGADGVTYTTAGEAVRGQFTDLKSDIGDIEQSLFLTQSVSGLEIAINNAILKSAKATSESATSIMHTGKNLLATPYFYTEPRTVNGITFTVLDDGRIHVVGTASSQAVYWIVDDGTSNRRPIKAGTYTFCGNRSVYYPSNMAWITLGLSTGSEKTAAVNTFTLSSDTTYYMKITVSSGKTVDCYFSPIIEKGASATEWEAYKGETISLTNGQASFDLYDGDNYLSSDNLFEISYYSHIKTSSDTLDLSMFGAVGDGTTDDTAAINNALLSAEGKTLYIPQGTYLFSGTLLIKSGTRLIGCGDSSVFKLANNFALDSYSWRSDSGGAYQYRYPMIATEDNSNGCILENFALEGQTNAFKDENEDGICIRGSQHIVRNVSVTKVNYFPAAFSGRTCITPCWGIMTFDADNVLIQNCYTHECGYEGFGVESSSNITIDSCESGDANQTGIQVHRNAERIKILNCTVKYVNGTNSSALTFDADPSTPMENIHIDNCYVGGALNFVAGGENKITINNCFIEKGVSCNNTAYREGLFLRGNRINGRVGTYHDNAIITDNIIAINTGYYMIIHHGNKSVVSDNLGIGSVTDVSINTH